MLFVCVTKIFPLYRVSTFSIITSGPESCLATFSTGPEYSELAMDWPEQPGFSILANLGTEDFSVERSMRIAQLVISPVVQPIWDEVSELDDTERGNHGFGSTGMRK